MKKVCFVCLSVLVLAACGGSESAQIGKAQRLTQKGEYAKAIQVYSSVIRKNPANYAAYAGRGLLFERLKPKDAAEAKKNRQYAERDYMRALNLNYRLPEVYNNLAALYIDQGRYTEAVMNLNEALALRPNYFMAVLNRAVAYSQQGRMGQALVEFSRAEKLNPRSPRLFLNRGLAEYAAGYYATAVNDYTDLISLEPDNARAYLERGRAFIKMGYFQDAMDDFQHAIALRPDYAMPYYYAAELLFSRGDTEQGIAYAERAKLLAPDYFATYDLLGDMLALESPVEATQHYLAARRLDGAHASRYERKIQMMRTERGRKNVVARRFLHVGER